MRLMAACFIATLAAQPPASYDDMFPAWSPGGHSIVFSSDRTGDVEIYSMSVDGAHLRRLTNTPGRDAHPCYAPDGTRLVFQSPREEGHTRLFLMNADGSQQRRLTANTGFCGAATWSPDGALIAFQCSADPARPGQKDAPWRIFTVRPDGSALQQRTFGPGNDQGPTWSPDSGALVFYSDRSGLDQVYSLDLAAGRVEPLTAPPGSHRAAAMSPDGRMLAVMSDREGSPADVYVLSLHGTSRHRVTRHGPKYGVPFFSPDGTRLLVQRNQGQGQRIWIVDVGSRDSQPLARNR